MMVLKNQVRANLANKLSVGLGNHNGGLVAHLLVCSPLSKLTLRIYSAMRTGRSYGGACSNAMLKVLYDAANEAADAAQTQAATDALFDDDDDDSMSNVDLNRNSTFASLDMNDHSNPSTITWSTLLRKMKAEMKDIGYALAPAITSTRKFDLNQPFSFVPDSFDPIKGKKRSLLIGCNYVNIDGAELKASHDDVRSMKVSFSGILFRLVPK